MPDIKILSAARLRCLNNQAFRHHWTCISPLVVARLSNDHRYPIVSHMLHNDRTVRCRIALGNIYQEGTLDIEISDFNKIPTYNPDTQEFTPCPDAAIPSVKQPVTLPSSGAILSGGSAPKTGTTTALPPSASTPVARPQRQSSSPRARTKRR